MKQIVPTLAALLSSSIALSGNLPLQVGDQFPPYPEGYRVVASSCVGTVESGLCDISLSVLRSEIDHILVLSHFDHFEDTGVPVNTVADIVLFEIQDGSAVSIGNCRFRQEHDVSIAAIVDYSTAVDGWTGAATWAKRVDAKSLKIRDADPALVTCNSESPT